MRCVDAHVMVCCSVCCSVCTATHGSTLQRTASHCNTGVQVCGVDVWMCGVDVWCGCVFICRSYMGMGWLRLVGSFILSSLLKGSFAKETYDFKDVYLFAGMLYGGYGVATISRLLKIIGLYCRISSLL